MSGGSAFSGNKSKLPPMADVAAMLDEGTPLPEIADAFGCSQTTLLRRLNQAGYDTATGGLTRALAPKPRPSDSPAPIPFDHQPWAADALCRQTDPEAFFPEKGGSVREAKQVCLSCDVREPCLDYALANGERYGIWGGLSERERNRIRRGVRDPRGARPTLDDAQVDDICRRYTAGVSAWVLAADHGVAHSTIYRRLRDRGIEIRPRTTPQERQPA